MERLNIAGGGQYQISDYYIYFKLYIIFPLLNFILISFVFLYILLSVVKKQNSNLKNRIHKAYLSHKNAFYKLLLLLLLLL